MVSHDLRPSQARWLRRALSPLSNWPWEIITTWPLEGAWCLCGAGQLMKGERGETGHTHPYSPPARSWRPNSSLSFTYTKPGIQAFVQTYPVIPSRDNSLVVSVFRLPMPTLRVLYAVKSASGQKLLWIHLRQERSKPKKQALSLVFPLQDKYKNQF